jgi:hypothetical protein
MLIPQSGRSICFNLLETKKQILRFAQDDVTEEVF